MSSKSAISVCHVSKVYALGLSGRTTGRCLQSFGSAPAAPYGETVQERSGSERWTMFLSTSLQGEAVGIVGKNGAGKSTLLKILSRITPPTRGHIDMLGTVGSLLEVGTGFHPELTGLENVYLNGAILGMSTREIKRRLEEILAFAEVDKFIDTPVKRYSTGMRVRLAFAVAAHLDPEIFIVDEVLSVGDHAFQAKCLERMKSVAASEGRTVLYVSHQLATVEHLCPRSLLIVDGRLNSTVRRRRQWLSISANSRGVRPLTPLVYSILPPLIDRTGHTSHSFDDSNFDRVVGVQPTTFGWGSGYRSRSAWRD